MDVDPVQVPSGSVGWTPNASTVGSGLGGAAAILVAGLWQHFVGPMDSIYVAAITAVLSALAGYLPSGGRK